MASSEAPNNLARSFGATCSLGRNHETIQKSAIAPKIRRSFSTKGVTAPETITTLARGDISPHMRLAENMAAWPFHAFFPITLSPYKKNKNKNTAEKPCILSCQPLGMLSCRLMAGMESL